MMDGHYIVKINSRCNANCLFCADDRSVRSKPDFSYHKLISELEENRKRFDSVIISGGEPTIYEHLIRYITHAKSLGFKNITLTTNAFRLSYSGYLDKLIRAGVDSFIISFISVNEKSYDSITKVKGSFKMVSKAIENINKKGLFWRANVVLHKLNYKESERIVEYLIQKGASSIQLSYMNPIGSSVVDGRSFLAVRFKEVMPYVREAFVASEKSGYKKLQIENFPICVAHDLKDCISDIKKPVENKEYYNSEKTKPKGCSDCCYYFSCDGVWDKHIKQFGSAELDPSFLRSKENRLDIDLKVKLIVPPRIFKGSLKLAPIMPLSTAKISSYLKQKDIAVEQDDLNIKVLNDSDLFQKVENCNALLDDSRFNSYLNGKSEEKQLDQIAERVVAKSDLNGFDLTAFSLIDHTYKKMLLLIAKQIKKQYGCKTLVGGSCVDKNILDFHFVDYLYSGIDGISYMENICLHLAGKKKVQDINGLFKGHSKGPEANKYNTMIYNILPNYLDLPLDGYRQLKESVYGIKNKAEEIVIPFRFIHGDCSFNCSFCANSSNPKKERADRKSVV